MSHLLILICIPYIAFWFKTTKYAMLWSYKLKDTLTKGKPFNCSFCLGIWFALLTYWPFAYHIILYLTVSLACGIFAWLIDHNLNKPSASTI